MDKYICIHGHFYQPPRENAWLEEIELQDSAFPFHDWNERITAECYGPNAVARILNDEGRIKDIVNNYSKISFNFGPTLLSWMESNAPEVYEAILEADKLSMDNFNGHGSAIAQAYNHIIMPLANKRDKETQVKWGIKDFESRFGRYPEGMWLPETAVDTETLEVLADHNIKFTILAPRQAKRVAKIGSKDWTDVSGEKVDPRLPYLCELPSGKTIILFFYDGGVSMDLAFKGLLDNGQQLSDRLVAALNMKDDIPYIVHVATDGESYGHHHRHGEMALAYCIDDIENNKKVQIINYGAYIEKHPPKHKAEIHESSSWSCVHGIERWRSDCGCSSGMNQGWSQQWREPLRNGLDWLRDKVERVYEQQMAKFTDEPWRIRNEYINVILNRDPDNVNQFLKNNFNKDISHKEKTKIIRMLEMQRNALLMYTSCGWFFDEVSGLETTQILQYANRTIQLAEREENVKLEEDFLKIIEKAQSNIPEIGNAREAYDRYISPTRLTLSRVGMHYAVASLFAANPESMTILNYNAESEFFDRIEAGIQRLAVGRTKVNSKITYSEKQYSFAVIYLGQHLIIGSVSDSLEEDEFHKMYNEIKDAFTSSSIAQVVSIMQTYFGPEKFSIKQLFKDEQRKVLSDILQKDLKLAENSYKKIYDRNYNIMNVMYEANIPLPKILRETLEMVINIELRKFFTSHSLSTMKLKALVQEVKKWDVYISMKEVGYVAGKRLDKLMHRIEKEPDNVDNLKKMRRILDYLEEIDLEVDYFKVQNTYFKIAERFIEDWQTKASNNDPTASVKLKEFQMIGQKINMAVEEWQLVK